MCDEITEQDIQDYVKAGGQLNRRDFTKLSAATSLAALFPNVALGADITESEVSIATPDGNCDAYFAHPSEGKHPGILMWPDIMSLRPAFRGMGRRLAEAGYAVVVVNPFYRDKVAPILPEGVTFRDQEGRDIVMPMRQKLTADAVNSDATAFVDWLDQQDAVDTSRKIGTAGYCMGGPLIMRTAAAVPDRVGAAASFHGGGMVTDTPDSPHLTIPNTQAEVLHALASNDDERTPNVKQDLRAAYDAAGIPAEIEVYAGLHGWCPPDSAVYNEAEAERAWGRLLALYGRAL